MNGNTGTDDHCQACGSPHVDCTCPWCDHCDRPDRDCTCIHEDEVDW